MDDQLGCLGVDGPRPRFPLACLLLAHCRRDCRPATLGRGRLWSGACSGSGEGSQQWRCDRQQHELGRLLLESSRCRIRSRPRRHLHYVLDRRPTLRRRPSARGGPGSVLFPPPQATRKGWPQKRSLKPVRTRSRPPARDGPTIDDAFAPLVEPSSIVGPSLAGGLRRWWRLSPTVLSSSYYRDRLLAGGLRRWWRLSPMVSVFPYYRDRPVARRAGDFPARGRGWDGK